MDPPWKRVTSFALHLMYSRRTGAIDFHYQPQFDAVTHKIRGVEALARWLNPGLRVEAPSEFIPVAEATGPIETLGELFSGKLDRIARIAGAL